MSAFWHRGKEPPARHADPDHAVARYLEAIRRAEVAGSPAPAAALNALGDAYVDLGDGTLAADHHVQAAEAYAAESLWDNAVACCRKVLRREPDHPRAALLLGRYYAAKGLRAEAVDVLRKLADAGHEAGRRRDALAALEEVVRILPRDARLRERLGRLLQEEGRHEEALVEYRTALELCLGSGDPAGAEHARTRVEALTGAVEVGRTALGDVAPATGGTGADPGADDRAAAGRAFAEGRWADVADIHRRLAAGGRAGADDFGAWTESARRAGRPAGVLEALEASALWHLARGRPVEAQRAAEEMLLVDPGSQTASALLERTTSLLTD
jgi:tetratricopeptide (TPR) repeat protein